MLVDLSDGEIARRVADGDKEAEGEMCRRLAPRIRWYGLRHLRSPAAADDLVQNVLLKTLEALRAGRLRDADRLAPFVLGISRMTVLDSRRTARRQEQLLETFGGVLVPEPAEPQTVDSERLGRCVQALKERERSVVVMTFYDEHTAAESGRALGLSEVNVRVIRHRAIRQLRACLESAS